MDERLAHKHLLKQYCEQIILQRIAIARQAMDNAQAAANQEEKSSAGDKYHDWLFYCCRTGKAGRER